MHLSTRLHLEHAQTENLRTFCSSEPIHYLLLNHNNRHKQFKSEAVTSFNYLKLIKHKKIIARKITR